MLYHYSISLYLGVFDFEVKRCGRNKRQVAGPIEVTSVAGAPIGPTCCVVFYRATVVWRDRSTSIELLELLA